MTDLDQNQWREQIESEDNIVIIDVRTDEELEEGIIPGAIQMDIANPTKFYEDAKNLDASKSYYLYCRTGARSAQACMLFNSLGIEKAYNLAGGIEAWEGEINK